MLFFHRCFSIAIWKAIGRIPGAPRSQSLAPDGTDCKADTCGLLKTLPYCCWRNSLCRKGNRSQWEEGDDISVLEFTATEYGRSKKIIASEEIKQKILEIGINKCARESGFHRANFIRKLVRGIPVKRNSYTEFMHWLESRKIVNE